MGRYHHELEVAKELALRAGEMLRSEFHREGGPRGQNAKAPIDDEVETLIRNRLDAEFPSYGVIAEEFPERDRPSTEESEPHLWIIDPNDGTLGFLRSWRGAAVSIGLMRGGIPVLGVVYAPNAPDDRGDFFAWAEGMSGIERNGEILPNLSDHALSEEDTVIVSQSADNKPQTNAELCAPARYTPMPSIAYRLALAASGDYAAAVSLNAPDTLDVLGGHALLIGAGGGLYNAHGEAITYDEDGTMRGRLGIFGGRHNATKQISLRPWGRVMRGPKEPGHRVLIGAEVLPREIGLAEPMPGLVCHDAPLLARARGCLLGHAVGDALGSQVEFQSSAWIANHFPQGLREMAASKVHGTARGQITDDCEMLLMLARTLIATFKDHTPSDGRTEYYAYKHWLASKPFDVGLTIAAGLDEDSASKRPYESQANGALMRVAPVALATLFQDDEQTLHRAAYDAQHTHRHPICAQANQLYCMAIKRTLQGRGAPREILEELLEAMPKLDAELVEQVRAGFDAPPAPDHLQGGWVLVALRNAVFEFIHGTSFEESIVRTIGRANDSDTTAAITGALLGARYGVEAIPKAWRKAVTTCRPIKGFSETKHPRPKEFWAVDLERIAEHLIVYSKRYARL